MSETLAERLRAWAAHLALEGKESPAKTAAVRDLNDAAARLEALERRAAPAEAP